ncbi:hypothetical protein MAR_007911 [Mya arenaria]|uniref:Uncharacterized protein n=1 Tax=Mya arenaria TaxID=6604 RepID=A0ABY7DUG9_MYAAR|nr:hypothetical protein MAR_007911 [Mya arenaria]
MAFLRVLTLLLLTTFVFSDDEQTDKGVAKAIVEEVALDSYSREECNKLLMDRGFRKKKSEDEELSAEELETLSYKSRDEL